MDSGKLLGVVFEFMLAAVAIFLGIASISFFGVTIIFGIFSAFFGFIAILAICAGIWILKS